MALEQFVELPPWYTSDWDTAVIEGVVTPGLVHITVSRGPKWDRKVAKGQTSEKQTFTGYPSANLKIRFRLWTEQQVADFEARILPLLEPTPSKEAPKGLSIVHPVTAARKVAAFLVDDDGLEGPTLNDDATFVEYTAKCFEYQKPAPAPAGPGKPGLSPCQQAKAEYDHWIATANALTVKIAAAFGTPEVEQLTRDLQAANDRAQYMAELMQQNGCNEQSPASQAAANGPPPP